MWEYKNKFIKNLTLNKKNIEILLTPIKIKKVVSHFKGSNIAVT